MVQLTLNIFMHELPRTNSFIIGNENYRCLASEQNCDIIRRFYHRMLQFHFYLNFRYYKKNMLGL
jgi:hypothetical protein